MNDATNRSRPEGGPAQQEEGRQTLVSPPESNPTGDSPASAGASGSQFPGAPGSQVPGSQVPGSQEDPLVAARAEVDRLKDQLLRTAADFDNFRKRSRREVDDARRAGHAELLRDLLPVFDNLERGIQSALRATDVKGVIDGLSMILKQFTDTLGRTGITRTPGVGSPFDPTFHEAIQHVETPDQAPGTIIAEVQPGYVQGDRLVRPAMVVVAKAPSRSEGEGGSN